MPVPRRFDRRPPERDTTRINERIRVPEVRLIDENGNQVGVMKTDDAVRYAQERDLDLVYRALIDHAGQKSGLSEVVQLGLLNRLIEDKNEIDTAGSMQVSVKFALDLARRRRRQHSIDAAGHIACWQGRNSPYGSAGCLACFW